jgi:sialate O-acetylesterase
MVVNFSNAQNGLKSRDGSELKGFIVAGEDKVWHSAKAVVKNGKQLWVSSSEVKNPVAVRYAWASWCPEANLINKEGLPASVFRSDKWDLSTKGVEDPFAGKRVTPAKAKEATPAAAPDNKSAPKKAA